MTAGLRHDVPHYAIFHSRNDSGICPICLAAEARSWVELRDRLQQGLEIAAAECAREGFETLAGAE